MVSKCLTGCAGTDPRWFEVNSRLAEHGQSIECEVSHFVGQGIGEMATHFRGLQGTQIPYGMYTYGLKRPGGTSTEDLTQGFVSIWSPEALVVVPVRRNAVPGASVDGAIPAGFVIRGKINRMPPPSSEKPLWIRLSPIYQKDHLDIKVDPTGEFRIYTPLVGRYILVVIRGDEVLDVQQISFEEGLRLKSVSVELPAQPPSSALQVRKQ